MADRFYAPDSFRTATVELTGGEAHHLGTVLRKQVGETVMLFDGGGREATAEIVALSRKRVVLRVLSARHVPPDPRPPVTLASAVPKGERFRWLVEKATELGVARLIPLKTARGIVDPAAGKLEKARHLVIEACKQSRRSHVMKIDPPTDWGDCLRDAGERRERLLVAHPAGDALEHILPASAPPQPTMVCVGPEGGLTEEEIAAAEAHGARLVQLGPQILRIETAAIACAAILLLRTAGPTG